jgi:hypothetical protein
VSGLWVGWAATKCTPDGCFASPHQADEQGDMHEIAHPLQAEDAEPPRDQQYERNPEKHLASRLQPVVPKGERAAAQ